MLKKLTGNTVLILLMTAALMMIAASISYNNEKRYAFGFYIILIIFLSGFLVLAYLASSVKWLSDKVFICIISIIAGGLRLLWILKVPTLPASDYLAYQAYAWYFSKGFYSFYDPTYVVFPFKIGYPIILSFLYKITGVSIDAAKALNIVLSIISMLLLYFIGKHISNSRTGRTAALMYAFWPAQIMYTSSLASEHIFMVFFLLNILMLVKMKDTDNTCHELLNTILLGLSLSVSQFFRPISLIIFPVAAAYLFIIYEKKGRIAVDLLRKSMLLTVIVISYFAGLFCLNQVVEPLTDINIMKSSPGFSMLVGTNFESNGTYNKQDANIVKKDNYDFDKVHSEAFKTAIGRITGNPAAFASLIVRKFGIEWGNEEYGYDSSLLSLDQSKPGWQDVFNYKSKLKKLSQAFYMSVLILLVIGCIYSIRKALYKVFIPTLISIGLIISFCFFEVQSRYHIPAMPLFFLISSIGLVNLFEYFNNTILGMNWNEVKESNSSNNKTKSILFFAVIIVICLSFFTAGLGKEKNIGFAAPAISIPRIEVNSRIYEIKPMLLPVKSSLLIPVKAIAELTQSKMTTDSKGKVKLVKGNHILIFESNSRKAVIDNKEIEMEVSTKKIFGTVYVPLRTTVEGLGMSISYDQAGDIISIIG